MARLRPQFLSCIFLFVAVASLCGAEPAKDWAFGQRLLRIDLDDFYGHRWTLSEIESSKCVVIAFLGTECPLAEHYGVRLETMQQEWKGRGVKIIGVMSNRQDSLLEIRSFARTHDLHFPILKDLGNRFANELGATRTPEVFVFDETRRLRYQGRVDDQFGIGYLREKPRREDLRLAVEQLIQGKAVAVTRTQAAGCLIGRKKPTDDSSSVTYGGQIVHLLNRHCVECHREGEIAPFALTDYEEVAGWADMIVEVINEKRMPPWHADPDHGHFSNVRDLSDEEIRLFEDWADAGAPAGDLSDLPALPKKTPDWQLPREPDDVVQVSPEPFVVPATGYVDYKYYVVDPKKYFNDDPKWDQDVWFNAAELKPSNRAVVHHILVFARPKGQRGGLNGARGFLVGYVPGARVEPWPKGHAKRIPANSELVFQVHYTPTGTEEVDQSQLGLCFIDESEVTHEIVTTSAVNAEFKIPPNEPKHPVDAKSPSFPKGAKLLSMSPHMHVRGKSFEYKLESSGEKVLWIPDYDFNWQTTYVLKDALPLEPGDRMLCRATFDNSEDNLNNPDPEKTVRWGDQTWDEMMIGYYHMSVPRRDLEKQSVSKDDRRLNREQRNTLAIFDGLDSDGDQKVNRSETPGKYLKDFDRLDANGDNVLTREEAGA